ncbi:NADH dehydrogenase subunit D [Archaeoglobus sulfaticallidus PM70-1]|uniref:NADH dehydrogenase subunit D n=1 Tax=Archaeoglobus sulfaticallidus PM70-1 TaxID=387631 RepID=N0BFG7_9EURY|nr:NADH-quinone oxidoreductase subunit D [Archaeoglobus sulfaticallidus]AGK61773.1 NADH dehydrogenase subunit D [Archaeoglobus sulfaticallidus PM70-1]
MISDMDSVLLNLGPQHPSTHGVLRLIVELEGERVVRVEPVIGYLHRGFEKIAENRNYIQIIPLTDKLDYIASMANNMAYVKAVEELMGIEVPLRAEYIRVMVLELQRIASHLLALGSIGNDLGMPFTLMMYTFREREKILDMFEMLTGARLGYNYMRIGGVSDDLPLGFTDYVRTFLEELEVRMEDYERLVYDNEIFIARTEGIGVLSPDKAINLGATGPVLRGSGVRRDVRKDEPYSIYHELDWKIITGKRGDCLSRVSVWIEEMKMSAEIVEQLLDSIPAGSIRAKVPKVIRPKEGEVYSRIESPRGELGVHLVSDGSARPYRLKIRSPAFCNLSILPHISKDVLLADLIVIIGSLDPVFGEVDR